MHPLRAPATCPIWGHDHAKFCSTVDHRQKISNRSTDQRSRASPDAGLPVRESLQCSKNDGGADADDASGTDDLVPQLLPHPVSPPRTSRLAEGLIEDPILRRTSRDGRTSAWPR